MEPRPLIFPNHVHSAFLSARLLPIPCRSASRNSCPPPSAIDLRAFQRSEEHTSELQSQSNLVCRLLLEKKKQKIRYTVWKVQELQSHQSAHLSKRGPLFLQLGK